MSLNAMAERVFNIAASKGWHDTPGNIGERIALIHSEASELLEAYRNGNPPCTKCPELTSAQEEVADIIVRTLDLAHEFGIDVDQAVAVKSAYNETRPHRHGGKRF